MHRMARRRTVCGAGLWALGLGTVLLAASAALARQGIVKTRDGKVIEGDVTEQDERVVINIKGIQTSVPRANVLSIDYPPPMEDQFKQRLAKLPRNDIKGRIDLAHWAFDNRRYDLARDALDDALRLDPNNLEATTFRNTVDEQRRLDRSSVAPAPRPAPGAPPPGGQAPTAGSEKMDRRLLSPADINIIRQAEIRPDDNVRVRFDNDVKRRFIAMTNADPARFNNLKPADQATEILQRGDPHMRDDVKILQDPATIVEFRRLLPNVLTGCAATACHGGSAGGRFILYAPADNDAVVYTDFYILEKYVKQGAGGGGLFGGADRRLIDRANPEQSLLLQYGLPQNVGQPPHPDVRGFRPPYVNKDNPQLRRVLNWIKGQSPMEPAYEGIKYELPHAPGTEPPATAPATMPSKPASAPAIPPRTPPQAPPRGGVPPGPAATPHTTPPPAPRTR